LPLALIAPVAVTVSPGALELWPQARAHPRPVAAASRSAWSVVLPATATVRLKQGGSLSGRLVKLTVSAVTLSVGHQNQTVALTKVSTIEFAQPNNLWVTLSNGRRQQARPIRGLSLPFDALPSSAIQVDGVRDTLIVDLTSALTDEQFAKLTRNPEVVHVLKRLEVTPEGSIGLWVRPYGMLP